MKTKLALKIGSYVFGGKGIAFAVAGFMVFALAGAGLAYWQGRTDGRELAEARIAAAVLAERKRMETANAEALAEASKTVVRLIGEREARDDLIAELREEATADPHAKRPAMSKDGAARMNRIR